MGSLKTETKSILMIATKFNDPTRERMFRPMISGSTVKKKCSMTKSVSIKISPFRS